MSTATTAVRHALQPVSALGRGAALLCALAWFGAWWTGWEELAVVAATLLVALVLGVFFTVGRNLFEIELALAPQRVTVGDRAGGELLVRNVAGRRSMPARVELTIGRGRASFRVPSLSDETEHDELFTVPTTRRAVIAVGPVSTVRGDPLGLLRREHAWPTITELYVHPVISTLDRLGSGFLRDMEGQTTQDLSPSDVAFHTLREYVPGDDRRHVHWKTTARVGTLMVRQFVDTRRSFLSVVLPTDPSAFGTDDEFELAISMAASIGVRALRDEQTVNFVIGHETAPSDTPMNLLDAAAGVELSDAGGVLGDAISTCNRVASDASIIAIAVGSTTPIADLRAATAQLTADARVLVFRAAPGSVAAIRTIGDTTIFTAPTLDDYSALLFQESHT